MAVISLNSVKLVELALVLFAIAFSLTAVGFSFAWKINSSQGFHAVMNLVLFPMWILSGALFPPSGASQWVKWVMMMNPLAYGVSAVRHILYPENLILAAGFPPLFYSVLVTVLFGLFAFGLSLILVFRPSRGG
mgnify:FL=1